MKLYRKVTVHECKNLKIEVQKALGSLEGNEENKNEFLRNPFNYLKQRCKILLINRYLKNWKPLIEDFNNSVKKLFRRLIDFLDNCIACLLATLILIYGLLAKVGLALIGITKIMHIIIASLEQFHDKRLEEPNDIIEKLKWLTPEKLARKFCELFEICGPSGPQQKIIILSGERVKKPVPEGIPA